MFDMKAMRVRAAGVAFCMALGFIATAAPTDQTEPLSAWVKPVETSVVLGEGDSRVKAREVAIDQLKRIASASAGSVVESITTVKDDKLTEQMRMISVSLVKLDQIKELVAVEAGAVVLKVSARASIDQSELARLTRELRQDTEKAKAIAKLQKDNEALREELRKVSEQLQQRKAPSTVDELGQRQTRILTALATNEGQVRQVFEKGALLAMADADAKRFEDTKAVILQDALMPLVDTPLRAEVVSVVREAGAYKVGLRVGWSAAPIDRAQKFLSKYLQGGGFYLAERDREAYFSHRDNAEGRSPNDLQPRLYDFVARHKVVAVFKVGSKSVELPIMATYQHDTFTRCRQKPASSGDLGVICLFKLLPSSSEILGTEENGYRYSVNPLTIALPESEAAGAVSVLGAVKLIGPAGVIRQTDFSAPLQGGKVSER
ncbi:hypothetical protein JY96_21255 [Aquabacterium sp. NJ1]|uniref:hypothetical protein n=1 Tax=Aquabacterium sp. NJ1 TaxID=1538295 RepID=UPI00052D9502|nr:hypothetical protein [Aquabacterium sp. NJ1]KGM38704.1 hypothetical protein JY96_21255 [Aquabacterium sp. NJ1]